MIDEPPGRGDLWREHRHAALPAAPLPRLRGHTRQPVLMTLWESGPDTPPMRDMFTTIGNCARRTGRGVQGRRCAGARPRVPEVRRRAAPRRTHRRAGHQPRRSRRRAGRRSLAAGSRTRTRSGRRRASTAATRAFCWRTAGGWRTGRHCRSTRGSTGTTSCRSKAEFTVAREFNVLPRSGWFRERSACYLAAADR